MILKQLNLVNFGVYRGQHVFDLRPQQSRPVVMFGGKNGSGKTTILEAIRLCLYGPYAIGGLAHKSAKRSAYEQYLLERIHRNHNGSLSIDHAGIALEFEHAIGGEQHTYTVERSWRQNGRGLKEDMLVSQNHQMLDGMDARQWQHFVNELIPRGIAQLIFLDGEKIQSLTETPRGGHQVVLSQTIKSLLGLNVVEQLQADLGIYRRRQQKSNQLDDLEQQIQSFEDALLAIDKDERLLLNQLEEVESKIGQLEIEIGLQEQEIARIGGGFARQRETHRASLGSLTLRIDQLEQSIREMCSGLLPFAITPVYTTAVKNQLYREVAYQQWLASKTFIEGKLVDIQAQIGSPEFWHGTGAEALVDLQNEVGARIAATMQNLIEAAESVQEVELRHHASEPVRQQLLQWIEDSQTMIPTRLKELTDDLLVSREKREESELALQRVPNDDILGPFMQKLNELNQQLGVLLQQRQQLKEKIRRLEYKRNETKRSLHKVREQRTARQKAADRMNLVTDIQLVLGDFETELLRLRITQLENAFTHNFNQLCRKDLFIRQVEIDPHDFSVTLVGMDGALVPQTDLSTGEQQVYAMALLWALRQVSGRPLPLIIDAPLGRLDSDHRQNLVERYFPHASHQVIILSTDTEVDAQFYALDATMHFSCLSS